MSLEKIILLKEKKMFKKLFLFLFLFNSLSFAFEFSSLGFDKRIDTGEGYGLLKSKADDEIFINGMSVGIVDKNENLNKKDILLKCGSIITIFFENGDISF